VNCKIVTYCFLVLFLISSNVFGQGLVVNTEGIDLVPQRVSEGSKNMDEKIENTFSFSLRDYCPTPKDQGEDANCVGWSVGYAAQTIRKAFSDSITDRTAIDSFAFSPYFIYNNIKLKNCAMGAEIPEALQFLIRTGNISIDRFEAGKSDCFAVPTKYHYEEALDNRIEDFQKLFSPNDSKQKKIKAVKEALLNGYPVVIAMNILKSFANMDHGTEMWYSEAGSQIPAGGHALVVIGFDELKNSFEVMNSWGDRWADDGFAFINYNDFSKYVRYGFTFGDREEEPFSIMINFDRNIMITNDGEQHTEKELFRWDKNKYTLASGEYRPNSTYLLSIFHSQREYNMYCFNASGSGSYHELFRIDGSENELITDMKSFGFSLPPLNFSDPVAEKFLFIVSDEKLNDEQLEAVSKMDKVELINVLFNTETTAQENIISFSRVAITGNIMDKPMIIPVEFSTKSSVK
jgi:hypothetical protein